MTSNNTVETELIAAPWSALSNSHVSRFRMKVRLDNCTRVLALGTKLNVTDSLQMKEGIMKDVSITVGSAPWEYMCRYTKITCRQKGNCRHRVQETNGVNG